MNKEDHQRNKVYLAALLHDMGKFFQRASGTTTDKDSNLSRQSKKIKNRTCPKDPTSKKYTHKHVLWTHEFLADNPIMGKMFDSQRKKRFRINPWKWDNLYEDTLINLAVSHHNPHPESHMQKLVQMADWWSAGSDRIHSGEDDKAQLNHYGLVFTDFRSVPLFSVFNSLSMDKPPEPASSAAFPLRPLDIPDESIFPQSLHQEDIKSLKEQYQKLWQGFEKELPQLPTTSFTDFDEGIFSLLKKYTWCIPSNTTDMVGVSLFDHLKTTAAIADSLYVAWKDEAFGEAFRFSNENDYLNEGFYPLMMLGLDISGMESLIYDVPGKKETQSLKENSFNANSLTTAIIQKFKEAPINAKAANTLYASGGKARLLLPNTAEIKEKIFGKDGIKEAVENQLWEDHKGLISINMASVGFAYHSRLEDNLWQTRVELENQHQEPKNISHVWRSLSHKLNEQKSQKFKTRLVHHFDEYFDENNPGLQTGGSTRRNDSRKTCAELANISGGQNTMSGILRMNMDDTDKLFIKNFKPEHLSLSSYSTLSFHIQLFFNDYLNTLRNEEVERDENGRPKKDKNGNIIYRFRDWLNILYSGGDELLVAGRRDKTIAFAQMVRTRFEAFTGCSDTGISGGAVFVHEKFPAAKAAQMAKEAERASKKHAGKNAFTFFGETVSWPREFDMVAALKNKLVKHISQKENPLSKSILHQLVMYNNLKDKHLKSPGQKPDYSFLWHTAYYLKRYVINYKPRENQAHKEIVDFVLNELQEQLFQSSKNDFRYYELAALAACWAEMELKERKNEDQYEHR